MKQLIKPKALKPGDIVATVSLSSGSAGQFTARYEQGKRQFEQAFGVRIMEMPHALDVPNDVYQHPENRLADLMEAFQNPDVKAILTNIGGDDTLRLLRLMDESHFDIIRQNPKIFMGMSDTTVNHFMCLRAGIGSFYSACTLFGYGENGGIPEYMVKNTKKTLFEAAPVGILPESGTFIISRIPWGQENVRRPRIPGSPWRYIQGEKPAYGRLIGGCIDVLDFINGTSLWPAVDEFEDTILFLETSEDKPSPAQITWWLRNLGAQGILDKITGILFARPGGEFELGEPGAGEWIGHYTDYDNAILKVLREYDRTDIPVVTNMDFGHTVPQLVLPYGAITEINPMAKTVRIMESVVQP